MPAIQSDEAWALEALQAGVRTQPGYFYDFEGCFLVIGLIIEEERFDEGIARLRRCCEERCR